MRCLRFRNGGFLLSGFWKLWDWFLECLLEVTVSHSDIARFSFFLFLFFIFLILVIVIEFIT